MQILHILKRNLALVALTAFLAITVLMLNLNQENQMHSGMITCPYAMGEQSMCPMNLVDHLSYWKQTFTADSLSASKIATISLFVPLLLFVLTAIFILYFPSIKHLRHFENKNKHFKLFDWLLCAIGKILQPRLYAPAVLEV